MEENNQKKGKRSVVDTSVVLSFVVAIFAIFSLAMAGLSMNQKSGVSYAAPTTLPDNFTFNVDTARIVGKSQGTDNFTAPLYYANNDSNNPIFCVEHNTEVHEGESYSAGTAITDYGLLYLLNNSLANGHSVVSSSDAGVLGNTAAEKTENAKYASAWVTQVAIWMYLYETDTTATQSTSKNYIAPEDVNIIKNVLVLTYLDDTNNVSKNVYADSTTLYAKYVKPLVDSAKSASDVAKLVVSKASDDVAKSEDGSYYFSSLITVTGDPSSALKNFTVSLAGIDGAKAIGEDGAELPAVVQPGTKFYVRIPAEKVTEEVQKVTISVNGTFATLEGKYYNAAGNYQKVVSVKAGEKVISAGKDVEFVGAPDTGMNTAQTIYFIGLIVLLCGVGIVYANAKPVQVKQ